MVFDRNKGLNEQDELAQLLMRENSLSQQSAWCHLDTQTLKNTRVCDTQSVCDEFLEMPILNK